MKNTTFSILLFSALVMGCGDKVSSVNTGKATVSTATVSQVEKIYNIHPLNLGMKYNSNPFEIRNSKALGRIIQTEIFAGSYTDEGTTAKIKDDNFDVFCRMNGVEYNKNPLKRGYVVVKGTLIEEGGKLGIKNCMPVTSEDNAKWREDPTTDDYNLLLN